MKFQRSLPSPITITTHNLYRTHTMVASTHRSSRKRQRAMVREALQYLFTYTYIDIPADPADFDSS